MSMKIFDHIGYYGPVIHFFMNIYMLQNRFVYMISYSFFFIVNTGLNKLLKISFREPRPENPVHYADFEKLTKEEYYGMPSGHAQSIFYSISFLYFINRQLDVLLVSFFLGTLTIYQRWKYRKHTFAQLMMGLIVGATFGGSIYYMTNRYLQ